MIGARNCHDQMTMDVQRGLLFGTAILAWVSYDATDVMNALGLKDRLDEAAVALIALGLGIALISFGAYVWHQWRRQPTAVS